MVYKALLTGAGGGLLISMLEKLNFVVLVKMDRSVLEEKSSCKMLVLSFSSNLNYGSKIIYITKTAPKNWRLDMFYKVSFSSVALFIFRHIQ